MLTEKDYCDYETSVALKELGCPLSSFDKWDNKNGKLELMPHFLLYSAQKWLREEKGIHVEVYFAALCNKQPLFEWVIVEEYDYSVSNLLSSKEKYFSYEEALSEGIKEAVKILKEK